MATDRLAVHYSSASVEHYTPAHVIDLVLRVLGGIALDPCSNSHTAPNVPAARHYTVVDDGLAHIHRGQSRRVTRNRDLWKHWAVQPLYGVNPLAGQDNEMLAKRRRMEREAAAE